MAHINRFVDASARCDGQCNSIKVTLQKSDIDIFLLSLLTRLFHFERHTILLYSQELVILFLLLSLPFILLL